MRIRYLYPNRIRHARLNSSTAYYGKYAKLEPLVNLVSARIDEHISGRTVDAELRRSIIESSIDKLIRVLPDKDVDGLKLLVNKVEQRYNEVVSIVDPLVITTISQLIPELRKRSKRVKRTSLIPLPQQTSTGQEERKITTATIIKNFDPRVQAVLLAERRKIKGARKDNMLVFSPAEAVDAFNELVMAWAKSQAEEEQLDFTNLDNWRLLGTTLDDADLRDSIQAHRAAAFRSLRKEAKWRKQEIKVDNEGDQQTVDIEEYGKWDEPYDDSVIYGLLSGGADILKGGPLHIEHIKKATEPSHQLARIIVSLHLGIPGTIPDQPDKWTNRIRRIRGDVYPESQATDHMQQYHDAVKGFQPGCPTCRGIARMFRSQSITPDYVEQLMFKFQLVKTFPV